MGVDQRSAYEYHRPVLQVLQSGGVRGRWTLKSPHHAIALDALTAVYPDAHLVLLHRDPVVLCGSVCSLITTLSARSATPTTAAYIGGTGRRCSRSRCAASTRSAPRTRSTRSSTCSTPTSSPIRRARSAIYSAAGDELDDDGHGRDRGLRRRAPEGPLRRTHVRPRRVRPRRRRARRTLRRLHRPLRRPPRTLTPPPLDMRRSERDIR